MKYIYILFLGCLLNSGCSKDNKNELDNITINLKNKSGLVCDSFNVYTKTGEKTFCDSLKVRDIKLAIDTSIIWDYIKICESDGTFSFKFFLSNGQILNKDCGYFTNSYNPYKSFNLYVYSDSLQLNAILK